MFGSLMNFFNSDDFMPHGHCFLWEPSILWLHVFSDALIGMAYFSIPVTLIMFARKRRDLPFRYIFILFSTFIVLCGSTHFFSIWVLWYPDYAAEGIVKALTGLVSAFTAFLVWKNIPLALKLPSPAQLQAINLTLTQTNKRIEEEVNARTSELQGAYQDLQNSQKKLQRVLQQAEAASRAKSEFLANMSHEIRTPMNAVIGLTNYLAKSDPLTTRQQECLQTMAVSANALMDLLNDLLDISRIEANSIQLETISFSVRKIADDVMAIMAPRAREKGLELSLNIMSHSAEHLIGDPTRLRQILINLLGNAIKFTPHGSVRFNLVTQPSTKKDFSTLCFEIVDTGIGIAPENISSIFEKFSQADASIRRNYGGSGLGLAITESLVKEMQGHIDVQSTLGKGSTFKITLDLPIDKNAIQPASAQRSQASEGEITYFAQPANKGHILIVEDWPANVLVAGLMLENYGYTYDVATTGSAVMKMFPQKHYSAVLMDIKLPDMNGYEATRWIRSFEHSSQRPATPIIATTAFAMSDDREKCLSSGMDAYLAKPLSSEGLGNILKTLLNKETGKTKPANSDG